MNKNDLKQSRMFANTIVVGITIFFVIMGFITSGFTSEIFYITAILLLFILLLAKFQIQDRSHKDTALTKLTKLILMLIGLGFIATLIFLAVTTR